VSDFAELFSEKVPLDHPVGLVMFTIESPKGL
jgi:hypothetical protein